MQIAAGRIGIGRIQLGMERIKVFTLLGQVLCQGIHRRRASIRRSDRYLNLDRNKVRLPLHVIAEVKRIGADIFRFCNEIIIVGFCPVFLGNRRLRLGVAPRRLLRRGG